MEQVTSSSRLRSGADVAMVSLVLSSEGSLFTGRGFSSLETRHGVKSRYSRGAEMAASHRAASSSSQ